MPDNAAASTLTAVKCTALKASFTSPINVCVSACATTFSETPSTGTQPPGKQSSAGRFEGFDTDGFEGVDTVEFEDFDIDEFEDFDIDEFEDFDIDEFEDFDTVGFEDFNTVEFERFDADAAPLNSIVLACIIA